MIANIKKTWGMKGVQRCIPTKLYEPYITSHPELEISRISILISAGFLRRFYINIERFY